MITNTNLKLNNTDEKNESELLSTNVISETDTHSETEISYAQQRTNDLGIVDAEIKVRLSGSERKMKIITANPADNEEMFIYYPDLSGGLMTYQVEGTKYAGADDEGYSGGVNVNEAFYFVRRHKTPKNPSNKYILPAGQPTRFFFPPSIVDKYQDKEKIPTLFVVEGQLKALKGSVHGFDMVGISGIHNFKEAKHFKLDAEFIKVIETCKVERIVILHDADARQIKFQVQKELTIRLYSFYRATQRFYELGNAYPNLHFYYAHIIETSPFKGLDDLMCGKSDELDLIIQDLKKVVIEKNYKGTYFSALKLGKQKDLFQYFHLHSVESFYGFYEQQIEKKEFVFKRGHYKCDSKGKILILSHPEAKHYIRVGTNYYKFVNNEIMLWTVSIIKQDYKNIPNFVDMIPKYDSFCSVPENDPNEYKQVINNQYNMYRKCKHIPKEGEFTHIDMYIKHIFGSELIQSGHPRYEMGYDWLSILYTRPAHKLPIPVLASKETGTGKSQLGFLLGRIYGENASTIGNDEINSSFNSTYIDKLVVTIEEALLEKQLVMEKLKSNNSNQGDVWLNDKGLKQVRVPCHLHFVLNTNNELNFAPMDEHDSRFWVIKVPTIPNENKDPDLLEKMAAEIPAFLYFLKTRKILHPRVDRFWFSPTLLDTEEKRKVIDFSAQRGAKGVIVEMLTDIFLDVKEKSIYLAIKSIVEYITPMLKFKPSYHDLKTLFVEYYGMEAPKIPERRNIPMYRPNLSTNEMGWQMNKDLGRYWLFEAEKWLPQETYQHIFGDK